MSGTQGYIFGDTGCKSSFETETFIATAGQTTFSLTYTPVGDVRFSRNGSNLSDTSAVVSGNVVTYVPAQNNNDLLLTSDRIDISYVWEDCTGQIFSDPEFRNDPLTQLVDVANLTNSDRGLSMGEVDIPTDRALTVAEMSQINAMNIGIPMGDMQSLYTNRAAETTAPGYMNPNGRLGFAHQFFAASTLATAVTTLDEAVLHNGAFVFLTLLAGDALNIPAPKYAGQHLVIRINATGTFSEVRVNFPNQPSIGGVFRTRDHSIRNGFASDTALIMRSGETLVLRSRTITSGWDIFQNFRMFSGGGWEELPTGKVHIDYEISGTVSIPVGSRATQDFILPVSILNPLNFRPVVSDVNISGVVPGLATNGDAIFIFRVEPDGNTGSSFRLTSFNSGASTGAVDRARAIGTAQSLDYAAIGAIASF